MNEQELNKNVEIIKEHIVSSGNTLHISLGKITNLEKIGESGGNGLVFSGTLYKKPVALKFLVNLPKSNKDKEPRKLTRFKAEFFNLKLIPEHKNIIKTYLFDQIIIGNFTFPLIVMEKCKSFSSEIKNEQIKPDYAELEKLFNFFCDSLEHIHKHEIVHRDLKPDNILIDDKNEYILTDFGIAHFDQAIYPLKAKTGKDDEMANRIFRAPEQIIEKISQLKKLGNKAHRTMDIYSMAHICHWFVTGKIHSGTNREKITKYIPQAEQLDYVIEKCLSNNPKDRFQSIEEIRDYFKKPIFKHGRTVLNEFRDCISYCFPDGDGSPSRTTDSIKIDNLMKDILSKNFQGNNLLYKYSKGSDHISKIEHLPNGYWLINEKELNIREVWGYYDTYRETTHFLILICYPSESFGNHENNYQERDFELAGLYKDKYVTYKAIRSGFTEIDGKVVDVRGKIEERYRYLKQIAFFIYTKYNSLNDSEVEIEIENFITENQEGELINAENLEEFAKKQYQKFSIPYLEEIENI